MNNDRFGGGMSGQRGESWRDDGRERDQGDRQGSQGRGSWDAGHDRYGRLPGRTMNDWGRADGRQGASMGSRDQGWQGREGAHGLEDLYPHDQDRGDRHDGRMGGHGGIHGDDEGWRGAQHRGEDGSRGGPYDGRGMGGPYGGQGDRGMGGPYGGRGMGGSYGNMTGSHGGMGMGGSHGGMGGSYGGMGGSYGGQGMMGSDPQGWGDERSGQQGWGDERWGHQGQQWGGERWGHQGQDGRGQRGQGWGDDRGQQGWGEQQGWGGMGAGQGGMGVGSGQGGLGASRQGQSFRGRGPRGYTRSDERIREDVNDCLTQRHDIDASDIEVQVKDGEVTLTGTVERRTLKYAVEHVVDGVMGVREIHNQLRIKQPGMSAGSGAEVQAGSADGASRGGAVKNGTTGAEASR